MGAKPRGESHIYRYVYRRNVYIPAILVARATDLNSEMGKNEGMRHFKLCRKRIFAAIL